MYVEYFGNFIFERIGTIDFSLGVRWFSRSRKHGKTYGNKFNSCKS